MSEPVVPAPAPTVVLSAPQLLAPNGGWYFGEVAVQIQHMPGGWRGAHFLLTLALQRIVAELETEIKNQGLVKVYPQVPGGNGLVT